MRIAIVGALWASNFGDVLLAKIIKCQLVGLGHEIIMPNASEQVKSEVGLGLESFSLSNSDLLIFCGGGYFSEPPGNSLKWVVSRYKALFKYATYCQLKGIPYDIIGVGAGPVNSRLARFIISHVCSKADSILLRDKISVDTIKGINPNLEIKEVSDLVLSINDTYKLDPPCNARKKIGVHLTLNADAQIGPILTFIHKNETKVDFYLIEDNPGEYKRIVNKYPIIETLFDNKVLSYTGVDEFIYSLNTLDILITSKLHVGIIGAALNKVVCSMPYHAKVKRLYEELGRSELVLDDFDSNSKIEKHLNNCINSEPITIPQLMIEKSRLIVEHINKKYS
jgi:polysaccharide pyruvyl transferase WcaK-like protein